MIAGRFDELAYRSRYFSVFCSKALKKIFDTKKYEDAVFTLAVTFACGFYQYEMFFPQAEDIAALLTFFTVIVWLWTALVNGFLKRGFFIVFSLFSWAVPQALILWNSNVSLHGYNALLDTLSQLSFILFRAPLRQISEALGMNGFFTAIILIILCETAFAFGYLLRSYSRYSVWYCKFRQHFNLN